MPLADPTLIGLPTYGTPQYAPPVVPTLAQARDETAQAGAGVPQQAPLPPPVGVDYQPPPGQAPQGPPTMQGISAQEALKLAGQTGAPAQARWQPSTRTEGFEGRAASPEYTQATADKLEADAGALGAQTNYDAALGGAQGEAARRMAIIDAAQARDAAARAQEQQAKLAQDRQHITDLMKASSKPDQSATDEYWGSKSTFGKIATALSMAIKGFNFSGYGKGQDPGVWLNQQIAQVVQEQQNRAAKSREAVSDAKDLYGFNKQALGDDERSKLATEMALRNQMASMLDRRVAEATADPMAQLRAAQLRKALADQNAQTLEQFWDKTADKHTSSEGDRYQGGGGGMDILTRIERAKKIKGGVAELSNDVPEQTIALALQGKGLANRKTTAETSKAEAEAAAQTGQGGALSDAAKDVKGTAYNPCAPSREPTRTQRPSLRMPTTRRCRPQRSRSSGLAARRASWRSCGSPRATPMTRPSP